MEDDQTLLANKARVTEARHQALALLKAAGVKSAPVKLREVIKHVPSSHNLVVRGTKEHLPSGVYAMTYKDSGMTLIGYNENASVNRQKFSVAHELGHLYMGHLHGQSSIDLNSSDYDEIEANQFAASLIMPPHLIKQSIKSGIKDVEELARLYEVSSEAMWWQFTKNGLLKLL